jgi:class 3 adenylate cyclase
VTATRRLAAILAAVVAGYSRLMGADEEGTLEPLKALRRSSIRRIARLRAITPEVMVNYALPFRDPRHRELYFTGLRLAMGEME